jgi:hypothetical protein
MRDEFNQRQYILDLLRSESTSCSYLYPKDQERDFLERKGDMWINMWQGECEWIHGKGNVNGYVARGI